MEELFLTCEKSNKKLYNKLLKQTAKAISDAFVNESAYSGPTPNELKAIVRQDSILPEHGHREVSDRMRSCQDQGTSRGRVRTPDRHG